MPAHLSSVLLAPQVRLLGKIEEGSIKSFREQLDSVAEGAGPIAIELMTSGGEADVGSDVALDEILEKASTSWYLTAEQALKRGLIADVF